MSDAPSPVNDQSPVIARLQARTPRRVIGAGILLAMGGLLLYLAAAFPPAALGARVFLPAVGLGTLWLGWRLWVASAFALELTAFELREEGGRRLALISDVQNVARGTFAFKPSNGFVLTLGRPGPWVWAPGLWWRIGRRVGVGGVTPRDGGRQFAELVALQVAQLALQAAGPDRATPDRD